MNKAKKQVLRLLFFAVCLLSFIAFIKSSINKVDESVEAADSTTSVTVSNTAPAFDVAPAENPASISTAPTDVGSNVTFEATGNDSNGHQYYLAVCTTNAVSAGDDAAPTCDVGTWCISTATNDETQATCSYTALVGDAESNDWYAFVCDKVAGGGLCSASSQGSGDSGSPFKVNHTPAFSAASGNSADPGGTISFTSTASDSDIDGTADQVKIVVCTNTTTAVVLGSPSTCTGGSLYCESALGASDPTCNYGLASVIQDGPTTFRAFVFDSHDLDSTSNYISNTFTVNNVAPSVSGVGLNSGSDITLSSPGGNTNVSVTATVTDNNSCEDVAAVNVNTSIYHALASGSYSSCDDNGEDDTDSCYALESCTLDGGSCTGSTDATETYTCTIAVAYHADPTEGTGTSDSPWWDHEWYGTIYAEDDTGLSDDTEVGTPVEMDDYVALNVTSSISYGTMNAGQDSEDVANYPETTVTAYGNVGLDSSLSGVAMCDDWPTCVG
ncbi:MAG: hypothetical protein ABIE03_03005, partial [Patescibacteria group bacterium]